MKPPLSAFIGSTRRVADAKRDHPVDANKMVCTHDPDPGQVRVYGFKGSETTRCRRCDAKLRRVKCESRNGSGFGPWRDAI